MTVMALPLFDNSPPDDDPGDSLGYMSGDQERPFVPCHCRSCESEALLPQTSACLYWRKRPGWRV